MPKFSASWELDERSIKDAHEIRGSRTAECHLAHLRQEEANNASALRQLPNKLHIRVFSERNLDHGTTFPIDAAEIIIYNTPADREQKRAQERLRVACQFGENARDFWLRIIQEASRLKLS